MKKIKNSKELGEFIYEINVEKRIYFKKLLTLFIVCDTILLAAFVYLNIVLENWVVMLVSILIFIACIVTSILNVKTSVANLKYVIYQNYIVTGTGSNEEYLKIADLIDMKDMRTLSDAMFKNKTSCLILYFNNNTHKRRYLANINDNYTVIKEKINIAKQLCELKLTLAE